MMAAYSDEDKCRAYMEQMRWCGNPTCPFCGMHNPYKLKDGKTYRCKLSTCRKDFTVTVGGTVFENSKVKLSVQMAAIFLCTGHKKGISSHQLARDLGVTQKLHGSQNTVLGFSWVILNLMFLQIMWWKWMNETYVGGK